MKQKKKIKIKTREKKKKKLRILGSDNLAIFSLTVTLEELGTI